MSHILLIEDNPSNADMIIHMLRTAGYEVRHFMRGLDGARDARAERPALILMDFNLPDVDGRTLTLLLKQQLGGPNSPPVVACTARTGEAEVRMAARFGCAAMLSKPFSSEELLSVVRSLLEKQGTPEAQEKET